MLIKAQMISQGEIDAGIFMSARHGNNGQIFETDLLLSGRRLSDPMLRLNKLVNIEDGEGSRSKLQADIGNI